MSTNLTPSTTYAGDVNAPDEGDEITAVTTGVGKGPVRGAFQKLFDKIHALISGTVSVKALAADGTGGVARAAIDGSLAASTVIVAGTGISSVAGDISALAGRVTAATSHRTSTAAGTADLTQKGVAWTGVVNNDDTGPNPGRNTGLKNEARALNTCKAWAHIWTDGGGAANFEDGANIAGVSLPGGNKVRILFTEVMASDDYSIALSGSNSFTVVKADMAAGQVDVTSPVNPQNTSILLMVQVFGRQ